MDRDTFLARINKIQFPFETNSFFGLHEAMDNITKIFDEAKRGGICFVNIFIEEQKWRLNRQIGNAVTAALEKQHETLTAIHKREFSTGDEDYDAFRKSCLHHDWYFSYSDDGSVWRAGNRKEKELEAEVKEKGGKYQEYWEYAKREFRK